jgi:hypothetical protein
MSKTALRRAAGLKHWIKPQPEVDTSAMTDAEILLHDIKRYGLKALVEMSMLPLDMAPQPASEEVEAPIRPTAEVKPTHVATPEPPPPPPPPEQPKPWYEEYVKWGPSSPGDTDDDVGRVAVDYDWYDE